MIYVGIDVAKNKHDCFAISSDGEVLFEKLTIKNTLDGFNLLINSIFNFENDFNKIKIGLEATKPKVVSSSLTPATTSQLARKASCFFYVKKQPKPCRYCSFSEKSFIS